MLGTALIVAIAAWGFRAMWIRNQMDPWTRDGRVRADIVQVTPDVSGLVTDVKVHDNQRVHKGQLLFVLDQPRFQLALSQAEAAVSIQRPALVQAEREYKRNRELGDLVPAEVTEESATKVQQLRASLTQALANRDLAKLNLERTQVTASVDGIVTDVQLRPGDYLTAGKPALALVYDGEVYVEGYFEETKLPRIHLGDPVRVSLMGSRSPISGHVESFAEGIADRDRTTSPNLLPNVNPTFNWVRLAQRIPVRVAIDAVPADVRLVAGQTATVQVLQSAAARPAAAHAMAPTPKKQ